MRKNLRNIACPCGSGKKYKRCCLPRDREQLRDFVFDEGFAEYEELTNSVIDLIEGGRLDDAERACLELRRRYPDRIDWLDRSALVHEARGDAGQAVDFYRRCVEFIDAHPEGFDPETRDDYQEKVEHLQSRGPAPDRTNQPMHDP